MTEQDYIDEINRLHKFTLQLSEHLYLAAEVLSIRAERKLYKGERNEGQVRTTDSTGTSSEGVNAK